MVSVDGFTEEPNARVNWDSLDEELQRHIANEVLSKVDVILLGRVASQLLGNYWPAGTGSLAPRIDHLSRIAFSKTLEKMLALFEEGKKTGKAAPAKASLPHDTIARHGPPPLRAIACARRR